MPKLPVLSGEELLKHLKKQDLKQFVKEVNTKWLFLCIVNWRGELLSVF